MDLQLYKVDSANYLVDFRNIGYFNMDTGLPLTEEAAKAPIETTDEQVQNGGDAHAQIRNPPSRHIGDGSSGIGGVSGPFHFLETACQLIAELASG